MPLASEGACPYVHKPAGIHIMKNNKNNVLKENKILFPMEELVRESS